MLIAALSYKFLKTLSQKQDSFDYSVVLKVGDTVEDIREGQKVGATTIAVVSGTQTLETLLKENPLAVLPSIAAVPSYLRDHGYFG